MGHSHAKLSRSEQALATSTPFDKKELERIRSVFIAVSLFNKICSFTNGKKKSCPVKFYQYMYLLG